MPSWVGLSVSGQRTAPRQAWPLTPGGAVSPQKDLLMHRWRFPSLSLHGIEGAFSGSGAKTVIPRKVIGKFSIRLVPNMTPEVVSEQAREGRGDAIPCGGRRGCSPGGTQTPRVLWRTQMYAQASRPSDLCYC